MSKTRIVAGIDIGSFKIATLIAQVNVDPVTFETAINIVGAATSPSNGVKKGQIVDIDKAVEATILSVEAAERMAGYNLDRAFVSVGGAHIASQNSTGVVAVADPDGEVSPEDIARVMEAARAVTLPASREIIHALPRQFLVDGEMGVQDPVGMSGVRLEIETHLITASTAALKNLAKTVNEVGVDIEEMVFSGLASSVSVLSNTEKELGCCLIDIGSGTTSIAIFLEGALTYSGSIPIGARNVTNDLAIGLRVSLDSAEKIKLSLSRPKKKDKVKIGSDNIDIADLGAGESKKISQRTLTEGIIRPRLNEIFTIVKLDLEREGLLNKIPSGAVITGGGSLTVGAEDAAKRTLSLPVRLGKPGGVGGLVDDILDPGFAVAVGLIRFGAQQPVAKETSLPLFGKGFKLPVKGVAGKLIETVKDLLP